MLDHGCEPSSQISPLRARQVLHLFDQIVPVERQVGPGPGRVAQSLGLTFGPADEVLLVELRGGGHGTLSGAQTSSGASIGSKPPASKLERVREGEPAPF